MCEDSLNRSQIMARFLVGWIGILIVAWTASSAAGQTRPALTVEEDAKLEAVAKSAVKEFELPGMCVAIVEGDVRARIAASGIRKAGRPEKITVNDRFHLGSCTKAMTATAIAGVVRDTKLDWDTPIETALPDLARGIHEGYRKVTLRQLLDHRSGLPANSNLMWHVDKKLSTTIQRRQLMTAVLGSKPEAEPGTRYEYSNLGYMLAALMAESAADSSWEDLMQGRVFGPLGMNSAGFGPPATENKTNQPWGHHRKGKDLTPTELDNPPVLGPAGTVHCTLSDWARFAALHLGHSPTAASATKRGKRTQIVDADTIKFLHQPLAGNDYTFGWIVSERDWGQGTVLTHSGSNTAWFATIWIAPQIDRAFLAATNTGQENAAAACDSAIAKMIQLSAP